MDASRQASSMLYSLALSSSFKAIWKRSICSSPTRDLVELVSQKLIKPSSPTPPHLRSYKISRLDQLTIGSYSPFAVFYQGSCFTGDNRKQVSQVLEKSLSETLAFYYPFAGRLQGNHWVDCNDGGASFTEARIRCRMSEILAAQPDPEAEDLLFPERGLQWGYEKRDCLLYAQLSHFDCGGKALSLCTSHKIADGCSFTSFLGDWAALTRSSGGEKPSPLFTGAAVFPPTDDAEDSPTLELAKEPVINRRYVFSGESLARLKSLVAAQSEVQNPTRAEVVTALFYKCVTAAKTMVSRGILRPSNLIHVANLRPLTTPPIPQTMFGNFYYYMDVSISNEEEMKVSRLVGELRRKKTELVERCKKLKPTELLPVALESDEKMVSLSQNDALYLTSNFAGFPWRVDFGWGQPERAIFPCLDSKDVLLMMDSGDRGGLEVQVTLDEETMPVFENQEEILTFASNVQH